MKIHNPLKTLTKFELFLWLTSLVVVSSTFLLGSRDNILTLFASLIGVTALIFVAKGAVIGQVLTVIFSIFYSLVSLQFNYYGEMITYIGMTTPIAIMSIITWIKNPYDKEKSEVKVAKLGFFKTFLMWVLTVSVTFVFYFILRYFNTANLMVSTISIATSFLASFLMLFRSPFYAAAYGANDIVLIILWVMATMENLSYLPMIICFVMFLCNDLYGYFNWTRMRKSQSINQELQV